MLKVGSRNTKHHAMESRLHTCLLSDNRRQNTTGEEKSPTKPVLPEMVR